MRKIYIFISILTFTIGSLSGQRTDFIKENYSKQEVRIPMRDGITLYAAIYSPRDTSATFPILMVKTPYGNMPYGNENYPEKIGPSNYLEQEKYIFVHVDARGTFMSEGKLMEMTPHLDTKPDSLNIDESSDTYDIVDWLIKHTNNNGNVGIWGISYRGFYASAGIIDAHPAIKCSSPQAPIANWFTGDDMHHHGAFSLLPGFAFFEAVGPLPDTLYNDWPSVKSMPVVDAYNFFLHSGSIDEMDEHYFNGNVPFWDSVVQHPNYDEFWQRRNILPHFKNIRPDVLLTGGLFDHENLYGSVQTYQAISKNSNNTTRIVLGPWIHGGWARTTGEELGLVKFGMPTSDYYQKNIELPFFNYYLKHKGNLDGLNIANVFMTGSNTWYSYDQWPPKHLKANQLYLKANNKLDSKLPDQSGLNYDEYISDPQHPVPYTQLFHPIRLFYNKEYMSEDQRFASARPDVLCFESEILEDTLTIIGPVKAKIFAAANTTDFDLIVKIIDVYPADTGTDHYRSPVTEMAGFQQLVRGEIFRVKYRNDYENPEPVVPGKVEEINIPLNDVFHAFLPGHKVMIQIQSTWFPLYNRNPQKFMNIYKAEEEDFQKATIQIYRSKNYPSQIIFNE